MNPWFEIPSVDKPDIWYINSEEKYYESLYQKSQPH